jgi:hypothetical protein
VSDPASSARTARESLSRGLSALQSDPNIPPSLVDLAAPIAQAMGALHQIERSNGTQLLPHANVALENVRTALSQLQAQPNNHPAVAQAVEAVASSLGLVHALSKLAGTPAQAPPAAAPPQQAWAPPQQQQAPARQAYPATAPQQAYQPPAQPAFPQPAHQPHVAPPQQAPQQAFQPVRAPAPQQPVFQPPPPVVAQVQQPAYQAGAQVARDPFAPPHQARPQAAPAATGDMPIVTADLGAQSSTNFYKGLSGNDIIDHGGLFVSTYMVPKIGTPVRLRVSLPGGYEFEANAIVRWSREQSDGGADAPPGFGAQFTQITNEARQLVYRYVRNREPLFHDDL